MTPNQSPKKNTRPGASSLRQRLAKGALSVGTWLQLAHPSIAEMMAAAGFEWITVDLEHSAITIREAEEMIRIISLSGVVPLVRVSSNDFVQIKRVMDAGAGGIIIPMVNTREDAELAVRSVHYPPTGTRGVGLGRAQGYGPGFQEYRKWLDKESIIIVQIEHIEGVRNLDAILSVPGVAGFIVGPYDLTGSLGVPGDFEHPKMIEALAEIRRVASRHPKIAPGYHVVLPKPELVTEKIEEGYRLIAFSTDMIFLGEACRSGVKAIKEKQLALVKTKHHSKS